jgi:hypothetical protein
MAGADKKPGRCAPDIRPAMARSGDCGWLKKPVCNRAQEDTRPLRLIVPCLLQATASVEMSAFLPTAADRRIDTFDPLLTFIPAGHLNVHAQMAHCPAVLAAYASLRAVIAEHGTLDSKVGWALNLATAATVIRPKAAVCRAFNAECWAVSLRIWR